MTDAFEQEAIAQIGSLLAGMTDSWNRHDMAAFANHFTDNVDFVNAVGMRLQGREQLYAMHVKLHETIFRNSSLRSTGHTVRFLGDAVAVVHHTWEMSGGQGVGDWKVADIRRGIFTLVMVSEDGVWRISAAQNTDTINVSLNQLTQD